MATSKMTKPAATLKLMAEGFWGAKAMERRVAQCCADNPACPFQERCCRQYDKFVDHRDNPDKTKWPSYRQSIIDRLRNYHRQRRAGIPSKEAARQMTNKQTRLALEAVGQYAKRKNQRKNFNRIEENNNRIEENRGKLQQKSNEGYKKRLHQKLQIGGK